MAKVGDVTSKGIVKSTRKGVATAYKPAPAPKVSSSKKTSSSSSGGSTRTPVPASTVSASSSKSQTVQQLNAARAAAVAAGSSPYAGNLKDLATFTSSVAPATPVVATTSADRASFADNSTRLDGIVNGKVGAGAAGGATTSVSEANVQPGQKGGTTIQNKPSPVKDAEGNVLQDPAALALAELEDQQARRKQTYNALKKVNDATFNATVDDLDFTYDNLRQKAEESSKRYLGQLNQAGYASDAFRYSPQITSGTIYNAEQEGIRRLQEIDAEENNLIAKARLARDTNNFNALQSYMDDLDEIGEKRVTALTDQYDKAKELQDEIDKQEKQSAKDDAIAGLVAEGTTDPSLILDALNFDEDGNKIGDYTLKEVSDALGYLKMPDLGGGSFKFDDKQTAKLLGAGLSMQDISSIRADLNSGASIDEVFDADSGFSAAEKAAVQAALGVDPTVVVNPGVGANGDSVQEQLIRARLFNYVKDVLNRGAVSENDAARINTAISTFRDAGMSEQEILDQLSGFPTGITSPYNSSFRDVIVANTDTPDKKSNAMGQIATLLNNKNYRAAMNTVENIAMTRAKQLDESGYMGQSTAQTYLTKIDTVRSILADNGFNGPIEGSFQNLLKRFKASEAVRLEAAVADLTAQFRNDIAGSAVTSSEQRFLDPLIPALSDKDSNFAEKLNAMQNRILTQLNSTRQTVGLPKVNYRQTVLPDERLQLYSNDSASGIVSPAAAGGGASGGRLDI